MFVSSMDYESVEALDSFFANVRLIDEQQKIASSLAKTHYFNIDQTLLSTEGQLLLNAAVNTPIRQAFPKQEYDYRKDLIVGVSANNAF